MKVSEGVKIGILAGLVGVVFYPTFVWLWDQWMAAESYYSHGPLIVAASAFFAWGERRRVRECAGKPSRSGLVLMVAAILQHFVGLTINVFFLSGIALIILLLGLTVYLKGWKATWLLLFPIAYLIFMIPLPLVVVSNIIIGMKLFAGRAATIVLNNIGIFAVHSGSAIRTAHSYLEIEAPCSGLRSLIALAAFGAAFAYLSKIGLMRKIWLFLATAPIALGANILRIVLLGWVAEVFGTDAVHGWVHDASGFLLFAIAALGLFFVYSFLVPVREDAMGPGPGAEGK